jgi:malonate-semialdehyde dehydrogenase (acetylating)/methylmalonate-semialdehyde dehydrogenase
VKNRSPTVLHHYLSGQAVTGRSERYGAVYNPATGEISAKVPLATAQAAFNFKSGSE